MINDCTVLMIASYFASDPESESESEPTRSPESESESESEIATTTPHPWTASFLESVQMCLERDGAHFEHMRK